MALTLVEHGDVAYITTPEVFLELGQVREHSDGLHAEVTAVVVATGARHWGRVNIASPTSRASLVKALGRYGLPQARMEPIIDEACWLLMQRERRGEPARALEPVAPSPESWLLRGWFPLGETSILYGDGAAGKSLLALALAMAGLSGEPLGRSDRWRVSPLKGALYLDWESQHRDHAERLHALSRMHGAGEAPRGLFHRPMTRALTETLTAVRRDCAEHDVDLVIVDSLGAASGSEPESADAAVRTLNALRVLGPITRLVIAHVSKAGADQQQGQPKPYGSVYVSNLARSTVLAVASESVAQDELQVTYHHTKINRGPKQAPRALRFSFSDEDIHVGVVEPDLARAGLPTQILALLKGGAQTVASLSEELKRDPSAVKAAIHRLAERGKIVKLAGSEGGRGRETQWGRPVTGERG